MFTPVVGQDFKLALERAMLSRDNLEVIYICIKIQFDRQRWLYKVENQ